MIPPTRLIVALLAVATLLGGVSGCSTDRPTSPASGDHGSGCRELDASLEWHDGVREFLQSAINANSKCTGTADGAAHRVAIFDWDNTVVKNDIGYATNYYMLTHDLVLQPANQDWHNTGRYLTDAAADALSAACGKDAPAGEPLPTSSNALCADEILSLLGGQTTTGRPAFAGSDARRLEGSYAWGNALSAGYTAEELAQFAAAAKQQNLAADVGATQKVGTEDVDGYIRVYPQIKDLIATLQAHGIDAWVVSASPEPVIKVWAGEVGIDDQHVVGVRSVADRSGKLTAHLLGCGGVRDGEDSVMPFADGKRCWANQVIFGVDGPQAFDQLPQDRRQVLAAGDSNSDATFVGDATAVSLAINRNKAELMCRAYDGLYAKGGKWAVNPMFMDPLPQHPPYPRGQAFVNSDGSKGPVRDAAGNPIADQVDSIF
ncbi:haloacid dehalogenase-like hydrolase [Mycobacterium ulcerans]|uniref:phosphoserine phosphatase n=1 Tax=Mycobacterium ulcerans (strain Agy99) TaxID=362242 RepID=A0PLY6_MYCUA|nr:haloacid dehalogenase-like hydrolase [Mycobacterium ulcerans]ABL03355.1 conserved lipoprotein, LppF [Mycobacterium ulcerans Agy99]MEB3903123.1 haloacid dehalogenase-like hydrolase [Mycobacterium ulcerans]MEB3907317.1 haloacid dehalogenase-like hydrolase [Mycobacterium ulcerans]MEB3917682.1 haloacid dehalogenase-like hydrolase [Mycobacterium ulcerans]MEB3921760.1 haloacid dehalogenase-like hydrolase [Mycobacterium ulcerans]